MRGSLFVVLLLSFAWRVFAQEPPAAEAEGDVSAEIAEEPAAVSGRYAPDFPPAVLGAPQDDPVASDAPPSGTDATGLQPSAVETSTAPKPTVPFIEPELVVADTEPSAPPEPLGPRIHVGALLGFGVSFDDTVSSINPLGFGLGARADYRLLDGLAVGGRFIYWLGGSAELPTGEISMSSWIFAVEVSHVLLASGLMLEPGIAIGMAGTALDGRLTAADTGSGFIPGTTDQAEVGFYLGPGATVILPLALLMPELEPVFVGADGRIGLLFRDSLSGSLELLINAGARF